MVIRCTQRLLHEMGVKPDEVSIEKGGFCEEWYAHLFFLDRRKHVLFMEAKTLFAFAVPNLRKKEIQNLPERLNKGLGRELFHEEFSPEVIRYLLAKVDPQTTQIAKTNDRRLVGCMNEFLRHYPYYSDFEGEGSWYENANRQIRRIPMLSYLNGGFPIEHFYDELHVLGLVPKRTEPIKI